MAYKRRANYPNIPSTKLLGVVQLKGAAVQRERERDKSKKNSGVHPRVSTLIQPSFQKKGKHHKVEGQRTNSAAQHPTSCVFEISFEQFVWNIAHHDSDVDGEVRDVFAHSAPLFFPVHFDLFFFLFFGTLLGLCISSQPFK